MQADLFTPALAALTVRVLDEPDDGPGADPWPERRRLLFATQHTARDIPALLRLARDLRTVDGDGPGALKVLAQIEVLCQEYVLSERICSCGEQLDKQGACLVCAARQRCAEKAAAWTVEDWDADTKARRWSASLLR